MKICLILKQSLKDYKNKGILYFVFVTFLTIIFGVIIGISSFLSFYSWTITKVYQTEYKTYISFDSYLASSNFSLNEQSNFLKHNSVVDENDEIANFIFEQLQEEQNETIDIDIVKEYIDFVGQKFKGNIKEYSETKQNEKMTQLNDFFTLKSFETNDTRYKNFELINNQLLNETPKLTSHLMGLYLYNNEIFQSLLETWVVPLAKGNDLKQTSLTFSLLPSYFEDFKTLQEYEQQKEFHSSPINESWIQKSKPTSEFSQKNQEKIWKGEFVYASPKYLELNQLQVGDYVRFYYKNVSYDYLIKGTIINPLSSTINDDQAYFFTNAYGLSNILNQKSEKSAEDTIDYRLNTNSFFVNPKYKKMDSTELINKKVLNSFSKFLIAKDGSKSFTTYQAENFAGFNGDEFFSSYKIFSIMLSTLAILLLVLTLVVFYFLSSYFLNDKRQVYYNLKAIGTNNWTLSFISAFSVIPLFFLALVVGMGFAIPISHLFSQALYSVFAITWPQIMITGRLIIYVFLLFIITFVLFFLACLLNVSGSKMHINNFNKLKVPSIAQLKFKALFILCSSKTRITFAFVLQNIYKNIACLLILFFTFTTMLFTFQFNISVKYSADSLVSYAAPYKSIKYQPEINAFSTVYTSKKNQPSLDYDLAYNVFLSEQELLENLESINSVNELSNVLLETSFLHEKSLDNYRIDGKVLIDFFSIANSHEEFDKNIYQPLITFIEQSKLIEQSVKKQLLTLLQKNREQLVGQGWSTYRKLQDNIINLKSQIDVITSEKNESLPISVLFGKVAAFNEYRNYWSSSAELYNQDNKVFAEAATLASLQQQNTDYIKALPFLSSEQTTIIEKQINGINRKQLQVEISKPFADAFGLKIGDEFFMRIKAVETKDWNHFLVPIKVSNVQNEDLFRSTIYFDKADYFEVLHDTICQNYVLLPETLTKQDYELKAQAWLNYVDFIDLLQKKFNKSEKNPENYLMLNNSTYSLEDLPINIKYVTIPQISNLTINQIFNKNGSINHQTDIRSYWQSTENLTQIEKSPTIQYLQSIPDDIINYRIIREQVIDKAYSFTSTMEKLNVIISLMTLSLSLILTLLILYENKSTIVVFKALGYKNNELNKYLISGYWSAAILALGASLLAVKYLMDFMAPTIYESAGVTLSYVLNANYIIYGCILVLVFNFIVLISIKLYTRTRHPKESTIIV